MKEIIFDCPVCKHKTDLTEKAGYNSAQYKCEKCEYPFTVQRDCRHNIVFMPWKRSNIEDKLICPHCESDIPFNQDIEVYSEDFDYECIVWDEWYRIYCPVCEKPFRFNVDKAITYLNVNIDVDDFADWWDLE